MGTYFLQRSWPLHCVLYYPWPWHSWRRHAPRLSRSYLSSCFHAMSLTKAEAWGSQTSLPHPQIWWSCMTWDILVYIFPQPNVTPYVDLLWACPLQQERSCLHQFHRLLSCWSFWSQWACQKMCWRKNQHTRIWWQVFAKLQKVNQVCQSIWPAIDKG